MPDPLVPLSGSGRSALPGARPAAPLDESQVISVTVMLRRKAALPAAPAGGPETLSPAQLGDRYGADPDDAQLVAEVLGEYGLTVTKSDLPSRRLTVSGTIAAMESAFGTTLSAVSSPDPGGSGQVQHRYRTGSLSVPSRLSEIITGVFGLDDRPAARPQFLRSPASGSPHSTGL